MSAGIFICPPLISMSVSSFPRAEHIALLRQEIEDRVRLRGHKIEVAERGLNHLKCQYKFGVRDRPGNEWTELAIHFQVAERLERTGNDSEMDRIIDQFLGPRFPHRDS